MSQEHSTDKCGYLGLCRFPMVTFDAYLLMLDGVTVGPLIALGLAANQFESVRTILTDLNRELNQGQKTLIFHFANWAGSTRRAKPIRRRNPDFPF